MQSCQLEHPLQQAAELAQGTFEENKAQIQQI
jgi:hypothetical protein